MPSRPVRVKTCLGLPCFTLRPNTEQPVTLIENGGADVVLGADPERIADVPAMLVRARTAEPSVPPLWDGKAAERIVEVLARFPLEGPAAVGTR